VKEKRGKYPEQWVADTTEETLEIEDVEKVINRATRTLNPKSIDGTLNHDLHGAHKVTQRGEYLLGLQATTGGSRSGFFTKLPKPCYLMRRCGVDLWKTTGMRH